MGTFQKEAKVVNKLVDPPKPLIKDSSSMPPPISGSLSKPFGKGPFSGGNNPSSDSSPPIKSPQMEETKELKPPIKTSSNIPPPKKDLSGPTRNFSTMDNQKSSELKSDIGPPPISKHVGSHTPSFPDSTQKIEEKPSIQSLNSKTIPPPISKPGPISYPKPSTTNVLSNQSTQSTSSSQTLSNNLGGFTTPPPTTFNKAMPGPSFKTLPQASTQNKFPPTSMPKQNLNTQSNQFGSSNRQLTDADLPEECRSIYHSVIKGIDILDKIDKNPKKRIELEQKMNALFIILANGTMKESTFNLLSKLSDDLDNENIDEARSLQEKIAKEDWDANKEWLNAMRRIILRK